MGHQTTTAARRTLSFSSLDQVMPDVDRLLLGGYTTVGNWSLGQICNHLTMMIVGSVEGYPDKVPWIIRKTIAPIIWKRLVKTERMPERIKIPDRYRPKPALDDRAEVEALRAALELFAAHPGPMAPSAFFGPLSRAQWDHLHRIHCAHHLSFAIPDGTS